MYCNQEVETMPRARMLRLQAEKLQKVLKWACDKSPFYREKLAGCSARAPEDLARLPFTTRDELAAASPFGFLTGPVSTALRLRMIGGSPAIVRAYTSGDIGRNVEMMARCLVAGGVNVASVLAILEHYAGENALNVQYAAEVLGATVVPASPTKLEQALQAVDRLGVTMLAGGNQSLLQLLIAAQTVEFDWGAARLTGLFLLNDAVKNNMEDHLANRFRTKAFNLYSPPELGCPGIAFDCAEKAGMHLQEDHFYAEVISLSDQQPLECGRVGELVLTSLSLEAMPFIRYRTGQIVCLDCAPCGCGRTLLRIKVP